MTKVLAVPQKSPTDMRGEIDAIPLQPIAAENRFADALQTGEAYHLCSTGAYRPAVILDTSLCNMLGAVCLGQWEMAGELELELAGHQSFRPQPLTTYATTPPSSLGHVLHWSFWSRQ